jgi:hypothetical protein
MCDALEMARPSLLMPQGRREQERPRWLMKPALNLAAGVIISGVIAGVIAYLGTDECCGGTLSPAANSGTVLISAAVQLLQSMCGQQCHLAAALGQEQLLDALAELLAGTQVESSDSLALGAAAAQLLYKASCLTKRDCLGRRLLPTARLGRLPRDAARQLLKALSRPGVLDGATPGEATSSPAALLNYSRDLLRLLGHMGMDEEDCASSSWGRMLELVLGSSAAGLAAAGAVDVLMKVLQLHVQDSCFLPVPFELWSRVLALAKSCLLVSDADAFESAAQIMDALDDVCIVGTAGQGQQQGKAGAAAVIQQAVGEAVCTLVAAHEVQLQQVPAWREVLARQAKALALRTMGLIAECVQTYCGAALDIAKPQQLQALCAALVAEMTGQQEPNVAHVVGAMLGGWQQGQCSAHCCWQALVGAGMLGRLPELLLRGSEAAPVLVLRRSWLKLLLYVVQSEWGSRGSVKRQVFGSLVGALQQAALQTGRAAAAACTPADAEFSYLASRVLEQLGVEYLGTASDDEAL